jgi:cellulose biosynthesis protein BcsQ
VILTVASGKGGVAKSSSAAALAALLRELGRDPVLVDLDSGADLTWSLGFDPGEAAKELLEGRRSLAEAVVTSSEGLRLVPGSPSLVRLEERGGAAIPALAARLRSLAEEQLFVLDTPPGFGSLLARVAIAAADVVLVPFLAEPTSERRARHVFAVAEALGVDPRIFGLAVLVEPRRLLTGAILGQATEGGLEPIAAVPRSVVVPESQNAGLSVVAYAPRSPVTAAYRTAAQMLLRSL